MSETEIYRELGTLTKNMDAWEENIPYVALVRRFVKKL